MIADMHGFWAVGFPRDGKQMPRKGFVESFKGIGSTVDSAFLSEGVKDVATRGRVDTKNEF